MHHTKKQRKNDPILIQIEIELPQAEKKENKIEIIKAEMPIMIRFLFEFSLS